jgi:hypothetical protein
MATALQFVNSTSANIFLTGKAGTGKTTFLKELAARTHKKFVVVAPTGVAALNAGGVTLHSQFLLPFGMFLPDRFPNIDTSAGGGYYTSQILAHKHPMNSDRRQVLRSIDLLVIDEVSMLRADLLDAIDYRLKSARGNFRQNFGGVQLLLIGDLYQLPPVVKREEESTFRKYYASPWFFESQTLKEAGFVYVELDKIFRQQDDRFIALLNNLRENRVTPHDIELLNGFYRPAEEIAATKEVITLTTHNYKADDLNSRALHELKTPLHTLEAEIEDDFPESMYPVLRGLLLKEGAQIMFTKNDTEGKAYYNGRLATVTSIQGDEVTVTMAGTGESYPLKKETWQNRKYKVDPKTQDLESEVVGSFKQYPVRLAWAVTVHKSQGLTFDKAIIDVGSAFADGQVYVALSRLRSLDGLILRARIPPSVIGTDSTVVSFAEKNHRPDELRNVLTSRQKEYSAQVTSTAFDFDGLIREISYLLKDKREEGEPFAGQSVLAQVRSGLAGEGDNTARFRKQLSDLLESADHARLMARLGKGSAYYLDLLAAQQKVLLKHMAETRLRKRVKGYLNSLSSLDLAITRKRTEIGKSAMLVRAILEGRREFDFSEVESKLTAERTEWLAEISKEVSPQPVVRKRKDRKKAADGPSTYDITLGLLESGLSVEAIAKERGLVPSTIEGHLVKAVGAGRLSIYRFMSPEEVGTVAAAMRELPDGSGAVELYQKLGGKFSFGKLRAVRLHLELEKKIDS